MRYVAMALILGLAVAGAALPGPTEPTARPAVGVEEPAVAVCPIQEGSGRSTEVTILSDVNGPTQLTLFSGGGTAGSLGTETGASGSTRIPVGDIAAVGTIGGLVELPTANSAAGVMVGGAESLMAEACQAVPAAQVFMTGGSTVSGEAFTVQVMNPYAGEAIVSLRVTSEAGIESSDAFSSLVIPAGSSRVIDFNALIPGRESLSVEVLTVLGRVIAVARQVIEGDASMWNAVPGAQEWFLPIPAGEPSRNLMLATQSAIEVDYQIDFYGPEGVEEALVEGVLNARGRAEFDLDEISQEVSGVKVVSTGPLVPILRVTSGGELATTTASPTEATRWLLPGARLPVGGGATLVILNASIDDATVSVRPLRADSLVRDFQVPSDALLELGLEPADGYLIESSSPIVVLWQSRTAAGTSLAMGVPFDDG